MFKKLIYFFSIVLLLGSVVQAADIQWTDLGADHLWSTPENWEPVRIPTLADEVLIDIPAAAAPNGPVIQDGIDAKAKGILTEAPGEPTLMITGGTLEVAEWIWFGDGADSFGIWDMTGGAVTVANEFELGWDGGAGTLTMTGGTISAGEAVIPTGSGAFGELYLYGGTYNVTKAGGLSVKDNGMIDITEGTLVLEGDDTAKVNDLIAAGLITAYGGSGKLELDFDGRNPGKTTLTAIPEPTVTPILKLDVGNSHNAEELEEGFTSFTLAESGSDVDGITIEFGGINAGDARRRGEPAGVPFENIYRDFIFGRQSEPGVGYVSVTLSGLQANQPYLITLYSWDVGSTNTRIADWTTNGESLFSTIHDGNVDPPAAEDDYAYTGAATADANGVILMEAVPGEGTYTNQPFAFINALVLVPVPVDPGTGNLVHSWTFDDGTADDIAGDAEGVLIGDAAVVDGQLVLDGDGDWMDMPGDVIAMNTFEGLTIEIMFTSVAGGNTGYHMVTAFGEEGTGDNPGYGYKYVCITPARGNDVSRGMIQTVSMDNDPWSEETGVSDVIEHDDGLPHHMVCTVDDTELAFYIDGVLIGTAALDPPGNSIAGLGTDVAHIGKGVYGVDPLWAGSVDYLNLYNRALSEQEVLYLAGFRAPASDVTAPGDIVQGVPNDGLMDGDNFGWPGAETPDLATDDDTGTKFLHFKGELEPTGFQVTPAAGSSIVTGLTLTTANDEPPRDPVTFELSGSNEGIDGPYELIASGDIVDFAQADAWPRFTMNVTPISFENDVAYAHYQVLFPAVRDAGSANSMQIAEVELLGELAPTGPLPVPEDLVVDQITSPSLEGNPLGDPATRNMVIYLPPGYETSDKDYPVVYLMPGLGATERWWACGEFSPAFSLMGIAVQNLPEEGFANMIDEFIAAGKIQPMIIVMPDISTAYGGSFCVNSALNGNHEDYIVNDIVPYIDANYRTLPSRDSRGIAGHCMGGYAAMYLTMRHPDVFGAVASHSGTLMTAGLLPGMQPIAAAENPEGLTLMGPDPAKPWTSTFYLFSAAFSPNLDNPPFYVDIPFDENVQIKEDVAQRWAAYDLLQVFPDHVSALAGLRGIYLDAGDKDELNEQLIAQAFSEALSAADIDHKFEIFDGAHMDNVYTRLVLSLSYLSDALGD